MVGRGRVLAVLAVMLCAGAVAARAEDAEPRNMMAAGPGNMMAAGPQGAAVPFRGGYTEQVWRFPMVPPKQKDTVLLLDGLLYKPPGDGPFKLVVMNHGAPRDHVDRRNDGRRRYELVAEFFLQRGFAVAVPMRRGYASSQGEFVEGYGSIDDPDFLTAGKSTANDISAVVKYLREQPFVNKDHIILMGQSAGGWGVAATLSRNLPGVTAGITVGAGRGSLDSDNNVRPDKLIAAAGRFGEKVTLPSLWLYSANDNFFPQRISREIFAAFAAGGSPARLGMVGNVGKEGHDLLGAPLFVDEWRPPVEEFLRLIGEL